MTAPAPSALQALWMLFAPTVPASTAPVPACDQRFVQLRDVVDRGRWGEVDGATLLHCRRATSGQNVLHETFARPGVVKRLCTQFPYETAALLQSADNDGLTPLQYAEQRTRDMYDRAWIHQDDLPSEYAALRQGEEALRAYAQRAQRAVAPSKAG